MIKKLLSLTFIMFATIGISQSFSGMYHFTDVIGGSSGSGSVDPTPPPTANGVAFGAFTAFGYTNQPAAGGVFAFNNHPLGASNGDNSTFTGSVDPGKYYEVTLTPNVNSTITINSITFNMSRSSTGPRHWVVRGSADSYSTNLPASIVPSNINISVVSGDVFFWADDTYTVSGGTQEKGSTIQPGANYINQTNPMTFRFYCYDAEGNSGTFRIDTVIFNGSNGVSSGLSQITRNLNSTYKIYPNPGTNGHFLIQSISSDLKTIELINNFGEVVLNTEVEPSLSTTRLDVSKLPSGIYFVKGYTDSATITERIIITNQ